MTNLTRCDRCGGVAEMSMPTDWSIVERQRPGFVGRERTADLCPNCGDALERWIVEAAIEPAP